MVFRFDLKGEPKEVRHCQHFTKLALITAENCKKIDCVIEGK